MTEEPQPELTIQSPQALGEIRPYLNRQFGIELNLLETLTEQNTMLLFADCFKNSLSETWLMNRLTGDLSMSSPLTVAERMCYLIKGFKAFKPDSPKLPVPIEAQTYDILIFYLIQYKLTKDHLTAIGDPPQDALSDSLLIAISASILDIAKRDNVNRRVAIHLSNNYDDEG